MFQFKLKIKMSNCNWTKTKYKDYDYISTEKQSKYYKGSYKSNTIKYNNFKNKKKYQKEENNIDKNEYSPKNIEIDNIKSFYPKNYNKTESQYPNKFNNDILYNFPPKKNNDFFNCENSKNNNYNNEKNEGRLMEEKKNSFDEKETNECDDLSLEDKKNTDNKPPKKFGIKNIPHPKRKKGHASCYISGKKLIPLKQNKDEENAIKKERKLSSSSIQNNFDSAKHSISTLNTSSSSYKEKEVLNDEKKSVNLTSEFNENDYNYKVSKNKFDENNEMEQYQQINPYLENTEILKVNVKLSKDKTVTFKIRRFDDLFFTIKLFCEINSIDEKFIKPLIMKSLSTLNTIYQFYNSQMSSEDISLLKRLKNIHHEVD